ncbi:hypothetical protein MMC21_003860 [Puttea exsequens]|nr:hypothetical protein [Puttea exsequens]
MKTTLFRPLFILSVSAIPSCAVPVTNGITLPNIQAQMCGTPPPDNELRQAHQHFREARQRAFDERSSQQIVVQTYFHFVTTTDQAHYYSTQTRQQLAVSQIIAMNRAYSPAGIVFASNPTTYTIKNDWATDKSSTAMKKALRKGTYKNLNIYFQSNLSTAPYTYSPASTLLGYCTLPTTITYTNQNGGQTEYPASDYAADGCNVLAGSMPSHPNPVNGYNQGKTAVHEVGHWLGLLHTFQDNTCTPGDSGDYIDDTPQESVSTTGCPTGKDSCPISPGSDPISNYMDYSTDACYTKFSGDQQARMQFMFSTYREAY